MNALTNAQASQTRANFVNFAAVRSSVLTVAQAHEELTRLFANSVRIRLRDSYLMMRRDGASFTLNRSQRANIYEIFANAVNHATFEV